MSDLHTLTALELGALVRDRLASPSQLVEHFLDRIDRLGPALGAFATVTGERARARAVELDTAVLAGAATPDRPLFGVPTALKDLNAEAGVPMRLGSAAFADLVAPIDDHPVQMLRAAGTVSLGKTATPELGLPCYTEPEGAPPAVTPWDRSRSAGGSSGGAGAAVAAGLVPLAQGSDGGGSIRIPASACGLVGVKPSRGRVSSGPLVGETTGLAVVGPLARTVRDAAAMLDALSVPWYGDAWPQPAPPRTTFLDACDRPPARLRVGRYLRPAVPDVVIAPECVAAWESASALLADLGHEVVDVATPFGDDPLKVFRVLWASSAASVPVPPEREALLRPVTRWLRDQGREIAAATLLQAMTRLQAMAREALLATREYDVLLTPTLAQLPSPVGSLRDDDDPAGDFAAQIRFTPYTAVANVTGQPAVSLPLHRTDDGLPVGVMLAGRPGGEEALLVARRAARAGPALAPPPTTGLVRPRLSVRSSRGQRGGAAARSPGPPAD